MKFNKMNYPPDIVDKFWSKVKYPENIDDCWEWSSGLFESGYGQFGISSKIKISAHRFAFQYYNGSIPKGYIICHRCDNKKCCNPNHLFLGTCKDNSEDMVRKGRSIKGEKIHTSILTECDVIETLTSLYYGNKISYQEFNLKYSVEGRQLKNIVNRITWKYITNQISDKDMESIKTNIIKYSSRI
jgi:hypothetical protein